MSTATARAVARLPASKSTSQAPIGFRQTEIGLLPEDWGLKSLQEIAEDQYPICYGIVQVGKYVDNGVPVLAIKNVGVNYDDGLHRTSPVIESRYKRSRILPGDVVVSVKGTTGRIGLVPSNFTGNISRDLARVRVGSDNSAAFVFHLLQSDAVQQRLAAATVGTTRLEISIAALKKFRIPIPPTRSEQDAIVEVLSDANSQIGSLEQLVAKKRTIKQGAIDELFSGKARFLADRKRKESEVGVLPGNWDVDRVENLAQISTGGRNTQDRVEDGAYPFFVRSQRVEYIDTYSFEGEAVLTAGDGVGTGKVFHYINGKFDAHQRVYVLSDFSARMDGYFFFLYFSRHFYNRIMKMTAKSSVDSVRREMIAGMLVPVPRSREEQIAIAQCVRDMDAEIELLEAKLAKARQLKQGMMQELLTGRTRLV